MDLYARRLLFRRLPLTAAVFLAAAGAACAAAEPTFPRGLGLYYSPYKLVALLLTFVGWVQLSAWLDLDANETGMDAMRWNSALLGVSLFAFFILWQLPVFWFGLFVYWSAVFGITYL